MANRRSEPPRPVDTPETGFYRCQLVRGGPYLAAEIRYDAPYWSATIGGRAYGVRNTNPWLVEGITRAWTGTRITEAEYRKLLDQDQGVRPDRKVNPLEMEPPF